MIRLLQDNINHSWYAQDMMKQYMVDCNVDICLVSEPIHIPDSVFWFSSLDKRSALVWRQGNFSNTCILNQRGNYCVAAKCGSLNIVSCYISPNISRERVLEALDELGEIISPAEGCTIVGGDFNAKSVHWGSPVTDPRGDLIEKWAAELNLRIVNVGSVPTCVRPQGSFIVDRTWASADIMQYITGWQVVSEAETMSDHMNISFNFSHNVSLVRSVSQAKKSSSKWNFSKLDIEAFGIALEWACAVGYTNDEESTPEGRQKWIDRIMRNACNIAAPKCGSGRHKPKDCNWWNSSIAELRLKCIKARRKWTRSKRRRVPEEMSSLERAYRNLKQELRSQIGKAKATAWQELLDAIEEDPWGLPYKIVLRRLRRSSPSLTETMDEETVNNLMDNLFPRGQTHDFNAE